MFTFSFDLNCSVDLRVIGTFVWYFPLHCSTNFFFSLTPSLLTACGVIFWVLHYLAVWPTLSPCLWQVLPISLRFGILFLCLSLKPSVRVFSLTGVLLLLDLESRSRIKFQHWTWNWLIWGCSSFSTWMYSIRYSVFAHFGEVESSAKARDSFCVEGPSHRRKKIIGNYGPGPGRAQSHFENKSCLA